MEICRPVLKELEEMGIKFEETTRGLDLRQARGEEIVGREGGTGTVESAIALAVAVVPEEKRKRLESGQGDPAWILDLDSDKEWREEEFVEWSKRGR